MGDKQHKYYTEDDVLEMNDHKEHVRFIIKGDIKNRLDRFLVNHMAGLSRSKLQKLINGGHVQVNGEIPKSSTIIRTSDTIDINVPPPELKQIPAEPIPIDILYEDDSLIVVNKQQNLVVHPARSNKTGTLLNALAYYFKDAATNGLESLSNVGIDEFRPGIVHRLDKDTTGCMVLAKTENVHMKLSKQFEDRKTQKYYLAVVHGEMGAPGDVIDQPIGKHPQIAEAMAVRHDAWGKESVTIYRVREVYDGYSLVELELKTGRTHQIRVHLTYLGFPIVGDIFYGAEYIGQKEMGEAPLVVPGSEQNISYARHKDDGLKIYDAADERDDLLVRRPALHAAILELNHPVTGERMRFDAPLHDDMTALIHAMRKQRPKSGVIKNKAAEVDVEDLLAREHKAVLY